MNDKRELIRPARGIPGVILLYILSLVVLTSGTLISTRMPHGQWVFLVSAVLAIAGSITAIAKATSR